jgi:hypothetical protein
LKIEQLAISNWHLAKTAEPSLISTHVRETYANLDDSRGGVGARRAPIAGIADIARHSTPESQKPGFPGDPVIAEIGKANPSK